MTKQFTFGNIDEADTDGFDLASYLEQFEAAIYSGHEGATEPVYKITGITWRDTSAEPHLVKVYDGVQWLTTGEINTTTHIFKPYFSGSVLQAICTLTIGDGLESSGGALRVKIDGTTLTRAAAGMKVTAKGITLTEISDQVDGSILTWNASGVATLVAPGTAGKVFTSNGAGALPSWEDPQAAGFNLISEPTIVGTSFVDVSINTTLYGSVILEWHNIRSSAVSTTNYPGIRMGSSGVINTGSVYQTVSTLNTFPSAVVENGTGLTLIRPAAQNELISTAGRGISGMMTISCIDGTSAHKYYDGYCTEQGNIAYRHNFYGKFGANTAIDIVRFYRTVSGGGNFASGSLFRVWGMAR